MKKEAHTCPPWLVWLLINPIRVLVQDPKKTLQPFVREGDTVLDAGCGPGFFITALAELVGEHGLVIAADIQKWMLDKTRNKIERAGLSGRVRLHLAQANRLNIPSDHVDFALAFWMAHEVLDKSTFFSEILGCLKTGGTLLLAEPRVHVNEKTFQGTVEIAEKAGFMKVCPVPIPFSHALLFRIGATQEKSMKIL